MPSKPLEIVEVGRRTFYKCPRCGGWLVGFDAFTDHVRRCRGSGVARRSPAEWSKCGGCAFINRSTGWCRQAKSHVWELDECPFKRW